MRQFHRWLGLITGFFFMFVALTGIGMETIKLFVPDAPKPAMSHGPGAAALAGPPRKMDFYHGLNHIHDGELAGPAGRIIVLMLGFALLFFSISGIWMYWKMLAARHRIGKKQLFW